VIQISQELGLKVQAVQERLTLDPNWAEGYLQLGDLLEEAAQNPWDEQAVACWATALAKKPDWQREHPAWALSFARSPNSSFPRTTMLLSIRI
jgi:hypothetical protein